MMKNKMLLVSMGALLQTIICFAQKDENIISQKADELLNDAYSKGMFSGLVVVSHKGEKVFSKVIGVANWETKKLIDKNTVFNIGSLNKKFTQEIISQLVEEKKLSYDDYLSKYLNLYQNDYDNKISIRQLVDMKAGLGDFLQDPSYFNDLRLKNFSLKDLLEVIKQEPLLFAPGMAQAYSNSGYAVLGGVIEKLTGKSYEENLRERIAKPLGLKNIYYTKAEIEQQVNRAYGTDIDLQGNKKMIEDIANSTPAGGIYTTIDDLLKFTEAKLLNTPSIDESRGIPLFAGGSPGWSSAISYNNKSGFTVVVLANEGDDIAVKIAKRLNSIINNQPFPPLELPFKMVLYKIITEKGYDYVKTRTAELAEQQRRPYDDHFLNDAANEFLIMNKTDIAINLYKVNIELFPESAYTCHVLADTYLKAGDKINALKYYKIELGIRPDNVEVKNIITKLEARP